MRSLLNFPSLFISSIYGLNPTLFSTACTFSVVKTKFSPFDFSGSSLICNIRPNTTQRRSVEKVPINDWQASVTLILLVFHRLDLAS